MKHFTIRLHFSYGYKCLAHTEELLAYEIMENAPHEYTIIRM
jgi:hypothetical protein